MQEDSNIYSFSFFLHSAQPNVIAASSCHWPVAPPALHAAEEALPREWVAGDKSCQRSTLQLTENTVCKGFAKVPGSIQ